MSTGKPKTVLVVCGRAIATSVVVAQSIKDALAERGITVKTITCKVSDIPDYVSEADLIVSTTQVSDQLGIPVIVTLAFLTGMGKKRVLEQIIGCIS